MFMEGFSEEILFELSLVPSGEKGTLSVGVEEVGIRLREEQEHIGRHP